MTEAIEPLPAVVSRYEDRFEYHCEQEQFAVHEGRDDDAEAHRDALKLILRAMDWEKAPR